ncbi:C40 family peptidase [Oscillatoria salina]|uniref:C40 family peptidase n=1 Tax=Oscillatoria salina TaxID=331517 RepID=UPI0013B80A13|nr:C40 family peptidase [Oscillatoria salina]MBZ8182426.1 C40 family peptidase [Oscillatoria salina IIICB1]NET87222.1 C40 family peptidase [Kamptonema sp. SIO1D9]
MVKLLKTDSGEYYTQVDLNLYDSPEGDRLATQAAVGRHLQILTSTPVNEAIEVRLCEDGYRAWLRKADLAHLTPAVEKYQPKAFSRSEIVDCLPTAIAFTKAALQQPNYYLWGGTVAPNYDCSGLMQAAFAASDIWLPRDSYQQADFTERIPLAEILPGDLIFFAKASKVDHVALYLGDGYYIHSSGVEMGRNGIGIDQLSENGDEISRAYYRQLWGVGRVMNSYRDSWIGD